MGMDAILMKWIVGILFILTYILIIFLYQKKAYVVWLSTIFLFLIGALGFKEGFLAINWNVIGIYVGMLFISEIFIYSKVPDYLAIYFTNRSRYVWGALLFICFFSGFISIFLENVAVVLIVAPIAFSISKKLNVSPVPMLIGISISSNLQGAATLIGDPPSMLLGGFAKLTFNDFFWINSRPGIFWSVQVGMLASLVVLWFIFKRFNKRAIDVKQIKVVSYVPTILLVLMVVLLAVSSFLDSGFSYIAGIICMIFGIISFLWHYLKDKDDAIEKTKMMDWETGFFLIAIFIIVESLVKIGIVSDIANLILSITGTNLFFAFCLVVILSVAISAFVDNVPYIVAMLPVVDQIAQNFVTPELPFVRYLFLFGMVLAASVGGNISPVGASANIVAIGLLKKKGYKTNFLDFVKIGLPFTIVSVVVAEAMLYVLWMVL